MELARSGITLYIAEMVGAVLSFVGILYFARELGASILGVFFLFQALTGVFSMVSNLGIRAGISKRMSEGKKPGEFLSSGILLKLGVLLLVVLIIGLGSSYINEYVGVQIAGLVIITVIFRDLGHLLVHVLRGELRVSESALLLFVNKVVWIGVAAVLISMEYELYGLVYGVIVGLVAKTLVGLYLVSTTPTLPSMEAASSIWQYSKYTIIPSIDTYAHNWTDVLIMGVFLSSAAVGAYEIAWRIIGPIFLLTSSISSTVFPQISAWDAEGESDRIERIIPKALTPALILIIPAFFGAALLSFEALSLLFGTEFGAAALALPILIAGLIPRAFRSIAGKTLEGIDKPQFVNRASVVDIVANVVLNAILIWQIGLVGAAIATSLSYTLGALLRWYYLRQYLTLQIPYRELGWCITSAVGMFTAVGLLQQTIVVDTTVRLFALVSVGIVVYGTIILLYAPLRRTIVQQTSRMIRTTP